MTFAVLYRWRLVPGRQDEFRVAWAEVTRAIHARFGTGGSRLHHADDGTIVAYAVWPDRATWEQAEFDHPGIERMRACVAERFEPQPLAIVDDLLTAP